MGRAWWLNRSDTDMYLFWLIKLLSWLERLFFLAWVLHQQQAAAATALLAWKSVHVQSSWVCECLLSFWIWWTLHFSCPWSKRRTAKFGSCAPWQGRGPWVSRLPPRTVYTYWIWPSLLPSCHRSRMTVELFKSYAPCAAAVIFDSSTVVTPDRSCFLKASSAQTHSRLSSSRKFSPLLCVDEIK